MAAAKRVIERGQLTRQRIIDLLRLSWSMKEFPTVRYVCGFLDLSKSTVWRHIDALEHEGAVWVQVIDGRIDGDGERRVGGALLKPPDERQRVEQAGRAKGGLFFARNSGIYDL